ncbi:hypothetical protein N9D99_02855 [Gammaproteobacteria bacterium]|jgi:hypothetical protein|nr:hypothetical protein [Gammaproteobacteria bacterium]MDB2444905.1 hypothetical protein [Gammaproteobacteria bacterium]MDC3239242.1 hypothetical protein [Gammaproteobacteria bacterium]
MQSPLLDPTSELKPMHREVLPRLTTLKDKTIGLIDISKPRGKEFLDQVELQLVSAGATVLRYSKPTFARTAPIELKQQISVECDAVIQGLAD